jgi:hypothetical protein
MRADLPLARNWRASSHVLRDFAKASKQSTSLFVQCIDLARRAVIRLASAQSGAG